jgi:16S rRNA G966 N2-methylase RsmD
MRHKTRRRTLQGGNKNNTMFPNKRGIDYSKLQMTDEGKYSMTRKFDSDKIIQHMRTIVGDLSTKHITDLTGNVGGDTISFGLHFKKVDSIELDESNFKVLEHNVQVYNLRNITLHHGDSLKVYKWKTDVLYIDPPWGGPEYKEQIVLDLFLGDKRIDEYISSLIKKKWKPNYIFLKLPSNYNFSRFDDMNIQKFPIRGFYLVAISV